jgi:hypothetical protein
MRREKSDTCLGVNAKLIEIKALVKVEWWQVSLPLD